MARAFDITEEEYNLIQSGKLNQAPAVTTTPSSSRAFDLTDEDVKILGIGDQPTAQVQTPVEQPAPPPVPTMAPAEQQVVDQTRRVVPQRNTPRLTQQQVEEKYGAGARLRPTPEERAGMVQRGLRGIGAPEAVSRRETPEEVQARVAERETGAMRETFKRKQTVGDFLQNQLYSPNTDNGTTVGGVVSSFDEGLKQGITTEIPKMVGGAIEFAGSYLPNLSGVKNTGKDMKNWANKKEKEWFGEEEQRKGLERIVYEGTKMLAPSAIPGGIINVGVRSLIGVGRLLAAARAAELAGDAVKSIALFAQATKMAKRARNIASGVTASIFGGSQGQQTIDVANERAGTLEKQGKFNEAKRVRAAGRGLAPIATATIEATGEFFGTKYLGKLFRLDEAEIIKRGAKNVVKDFLKTLGVEIGTEVGQQAVEASVEKYSGIRPEAEPLMEALDVIGPTAFMTLLTGGIAGVSNIRGKDAQLEEAADYVQNMQDDAESQKALTGLPSEYSLIKPPVSVPAGARIVSEREGASIPAEAQPEAGIPITATRPMPPVSVPQKVKELLDNPKQADDIINQIVAQGTVDIPELQSAIEGEVGQPTRPMEIEAPPAPVAVQPQEVPEPAEITAKPPLETIIPESAGEDTAQGEIVAPVEGKPAGEGVGALGQMTPEEEYDSARQEWKNASGEFRRIREAYRAKTIGDSEFLAGKKTFNDASDVFDVAETKFIEAKNKPSAVPPISPKEGEGGKVTFRKNEGGAGRVVSMDGEDVGTVMFSKTRSTKDKLHLEWFELDKEHRGKNKGVAILRKIFADNPDIKYIHAEVMNKEDEGYWRKIGGIVNSDGYLTLDKSKLSPKEGTEGGKVEYYHGSPSGDFGNGAIHIGTKKAAQQALEARIGIPADGKGWDGSREYGKTLLAGKKTLRKLDPKGYNETGFNVDVPENDFYLTDYPELAKQSKYGSGDVVSLQSKPNIFQVKISGEMTNTPDAPMEDTMANARMSGQIKRGQAKRGYYYKNIGEDEGSISAVVPSKQHLSKLSPKEGEGGKVLTKQEMINRGADGYLSKAVEMEIPLSKIDGREPTPAMEGGYKKGTPITQPIEVIYDKATDKYMLYSGNHRVTQAEVNGQSTIKAFVENAPKLSPKEGEAQEGKPPEQREPVSPGGYVKRGLASAMKMRQDEPSGSLANYAEREQGEWLGEQPRPDKSVTLYRATPTGDPIVAGDYVTNNRKYAQDHIKNNLGGKGKITSVEATLDDIYPADGTKEFWYVPKSLEKSPTQPQVEESEAVLELPKLSEPVSNVKKTKTTQPSESKIKILVEQYNASGRVAFRYPRNGRISIDGLNMTESEAVTKMEQVLSTQPQVEEKAAEKKPVRQVVPKRKAKVEKPAPKPAPQAELEAKEVMKPGEKHANPMTSKMRSIADIRREFTRRNLEGELDDLIEKLSTAEQEASLGNFGLQRKLSVGPGYREAGEFYSSGSVYPKGFNKQSRPILQKFKRGEPLTARQAEVVQLALDHIGRMVFHDMPKVDIKAGELTEGDVVEMDGDPHRVISKTKEKVVLKDGETLTVKPDDELTIDAGSYSSKTAQPELSAQSELTDLEEVDDDSFDVESLGSVESKKPAEGLELKSATPEELESEKKKQADREKLRELAAAPILGKPIEATGDLFDRTQSENPLFAPPAPKAKEKPTRQVVPNRKSETTTTPAQPVAEEKPMTVLEAVEQGIPIKAPLGTVRVKVTMADGRAFAVNVGDLDTVSGVGKIKKLEALQGKDKPLKGEFTVKQKKGEAPKYSKEGQQGVPEENLLAIERRIVQSSITRRQNEDKEDIITGKDTAQGSNAGRNGVLLPARQERELQSLIDSGAQEGPFKGAKPDTTFPLTPEGQRLIRQANRGGLSLIATRGSGHGVGGAYRNGIIFLNLDAFSNKRRTVAHEVAHNEYQNPDSPLREIAKYIDIASEEAQAFKNAYENDTNSELTEEGLREEIAVELATGRVNLDGVQFVKTLTDAEHVANLLDTYNGTPTRAGPETGVAGKMKDMRFTTEELVKKLRSLTKQEQLDSQSSLAKNGLSLGKFMKGSRSYSVDGVPGAVVFLSKDVTYLSAVKRGDMETAQKMVDEAAKKAGYDKDVFHGTNNSGLTTQFKLASHFGTRKAAEERLNAIGFEEGKERILPVKIKLDNPIETTDLGLFSAFDIASEGAGRSGVERLTQYAITTLSQEERIIASQRLGFNENYNPSDAELEEALLGKYDNLNKRGSDVYEYLYGDPRDARSGDNDHPDIMELAVKIAEENGYDGMIYRNEVEDVGSTSYVVFRPANVKSADPVTYDDAGNVIPLSQRFQPTSPDIRYAKEEKPTRVVVPRGMRVRTAINKTTGVTRPTEKVTLPEYLLLKNQLRFESKAAKESAVSKRKEVLGDVKEKADKQKAISRFKSALPADKEIKEMSPILRDKITELISGIDTSKMNPNTKRSLSRMADWMADPENEIATLPPMVLNGMKEKIARLDKKAISDFETEEINALTSMVKAYIHQQKLKDKLIDKQEAREMGRITDSFVADLSDKKPLPSVSLVSKRNRNPAQRLGDRIVEFSNFLRTRGMASQETEMERMGPTAHKYLHEEPLKGLETATLIGQEQWDKMQEVLTSEGWKWGSKELNELSDAASGRGQAKTVTVTLESGKDMIVTPAELMLLMATTGQDYVVKQINNKTVGFLPSSHDPSSQPFKITMNDISAIQKQNPELYKTAQAIGEMFSDLTPMLNKWSVKAYGYEMFTDGKGHIPIKTSSIHRNEKGMDEEEDIMQSWVMSTPEMQSMMQERTGRSGVIVLEDIFSAFAHHVHASSILMGMQEPISKAKKIIGNESVKREIVRVFGQKELNQIKDRIKTWTMMPQPGQLPVEGEGRLSHLLNNIVKSKLVLNPSPILKQISGAFPLLSEFADSPAEQWRLAITYGFKRMFDPEWHKITYANAPLLRDRAEQSASRLVQSQSSSAKPLLGREGVTEKMMHGLSWSDANNSVLAFATFAGKLREEHPDWSDSEIYQQAGHMATVSVGRTQNAANIMDDTGLAMQSRKSLALKLVTTFKSQPMAIYNTILRANRKFQKSPKTKMDFLNLVHTVVMSLIVPAIISSLISAGLLEAKYRLWRLIFGKKDKEEKKRESTVEKMAWNMLNDAADTYTYGGGDIVDAGRKLNNIIRKRSWMGQDLGKDNLLSDALSNFLEGTTEFTRAGMAEKQDVNKYVHASLTTMMGLANAFGLPEYPIRTLRTGVDINAEKEKPFKIPSPSKSESTTRRLIPARMPTRSNR